MDDVDYNDAQKALKQLQDKAKAARLAAAEAAEQEAKLAEQIQRLLARREEERLKAEEAARVEAEEAAAARVAAEEAAAARVAAEEAAAARVAAEEAEAARVAAKRAKREKGKRERAAREKAAREKAELFAAAAQALEEHDRRVAKEKGKVLAQTATMQQQPRPAHSSNQNPQAGVATSFVKNQWMPKFDSKGVEDDEGLGHRTEGGSSEDVIMADADSTHKKKGKKPMKRPLEADEESSGRNKKPKMNTSMGLVPAGDVSKVVCDECKDKEEECIGRTLTGACYGCRASKKACKVDGQSIRPHSSRQPAGSVIAVEESSNPTAAEGSQVAALARANFELAEKVQGFEDLVRRLYKAAIGDEDLVPVVTAYIVGRDQANGGKAQQTDDNKALH